MVFHQPSAPLRPFIRHFLIMENREEMVNRVVPDTALVMVFRFQGQVRFLSDGYTIELPPMVISGLKKSVRLVHYLKETGAILVVFKETGAASFFREPLYELFEESVSLDNFVHPAELSLVEDQLSEAKNNVDRIAVVERFLWSRFTGRKPDGLVLAAIQNIRETKGQVRVKDLAGSLFISQDAFEKRFRNVVGASPKQFSSIVRMKSVMLGARQQKTFTEMAYDADFFDQAHFNKAFRLFTGQTPAEFFKSPPAW
ncbi:MAG: hypothetical protein EPGJADBJ_02670 [Saprospiraceae bacterium]|nr:hypothetical protein [Saprospiraceae bacterium]